MSTTEYETLSSEEKSKYKEKLIKLKKDSKRKEKLSIMLSSIFDKRFIANVIERNNEKISLENYEDICDNIILLFNDKTFSLENIETKVKELLLRNTIFNVSDVLDSIRTKGILFMAGAFATVSFTYLDTTSRICLWKSSRLKLLSLCNLIN